MLRKALERLRDDELVEAYKIAWEEWEASGDAALWDLTVGDGPGARRLVGGAGR